MPYYLIVAFQAFCIYHLIKNRNNYYWIFAIIFLPVVGCILYLVTQVFNKRDKDKIQESLTTIINPSKKVKDLERKLLFSETYLNIVNLADAYYASNDFANAVLYYKKALQDKSQNEFHVKKQLIKSYYYLEDYNSVVEACENIHQHPEFLKSDMPFVYGLSLDHIGRVEEAEIQLRKMDQPYSNYKERIALIKFLMNKDRSKEANEILNDVYNETQLMTQANRRNHRAAISEIEKMKSTQ